jgi:hypothetical protein
LKGDFEFGWEADSHRCATGAACLHFNFCVQ